MTETKIGILARTPGEERAGDREVALSSGVPDSDTTIRCTSWGCEAHEDHEFIWYRVQSVGVSPCKIQNPQTEVCATKTPLVNDWLVRLNLTIAYVNNTIRPPRHVIFMCN